VELDADGQIELLSRYVSAEAVVYIDGQRCHDCQISIDPEPTLEPDMLALQQPLPIRKALADGRVVDNLPDRLHITFGAAPEPLPGRSIVMIQVQNPGSYTSNEVPIELPTPAAP
jgi:hypothetical protein